MYLVQQLCTGGELPDWLAQQPEYSEWLAARVAYDGSATAEERDAYVAAHGCVAWTEPALDLSSLHEILLDDSTGSVSMTPSLDDIQAAINRCSRAILGCSRQLLCWGRPEERELGKTIFEDIARDKEIVKMVLLLTGGFEGIKREVMSYLETFM